MLRARHALQHIQAAGRRLVCSPCLLASPMMYRRKKSLHETGPDDPTL